MSIKMKKLAAAVLMLSLLMTACATRQAHRQLVEKLNGACQQGDMQACAAVLQDMNSRQQRLAILGAGLFARPAYGY